MRLINLASFVGAALSLLGCGPKAPRYEDTGHLENPPPKPPKCPETPELANLKSGNGAIADVRILQFRATKLYVPAEWLRPHFVDLEGRRGGYLDKTLLSQFSPDIHSVECPGIVHKFFEDDNSAPRDVVPFVDIWVGGGNAPPAQISSSGDIAMLALTANQYPPGPRLRVALGGGFYDAKIVPLPDVLVLLRTRGSHGRRAVSSGSIVELAKWLATPPTLRDPDRKFTLTIDSALR